AERLAGLGKPARRFMKGVVARTDEAVDRIADDVLRLRGEGCRRSQEANGDSHPGAKNGPLARPSSRPGKVVGQQLDKGTVSHQSDSRNVTSASRSAFGRSAKRSRAACASPPCQRIAS